MASKFTVAQMIQRENFSNRWEEGKPIGLHEVLLPRSCKASIRWLSKRTWR